MGAGGDGGASVLASELDVPAELSRRRLRSRLAFALGVVAVVAALILLLPGLGELRTRLSHARPGWLAAGVVLKVLSGLGYVAVFRGVFCRRMSWRVSYLVGMSELGANALFPTGGAGGLALGAWALRRSGMPAGEIARRTVAFFLLTSVANVTVVIMLGVLLASGVLPGTHALTLTLLPACVAALAIMATLRAGRAAMRLQARAERGGRGDSRRARALLGTLRAVAGGVSDAVAQLRERDPVLLAGIVAYLLFDVMILWATFRSFGAAPPAAVVGLAYLIGELGGLIPLPGGIGGVDAGLVGTLVLYKVPLVSAGAAVLAYRAIALWVPALLGAGAFVGLRRTLRREANEIALCGPQAEMDVIGRGRVVIRGAAGHTVSSRASSSKAPT